MYKINLNVDSRSLKDKTKLVVSGDHRFVFSGLLGQNRLYAQFVQLLFEQVSTLLQRSQDGGV